MRYIFYTIILSIIVSCSQYTKKDTPIIENNFSRFYSFDIGYNNSHIIQGMYKKNNSKVYYFFNHIFTDYISVYDENQKKIDSIFVGDYNSKSNPIVGVKFFNQDTILLNTKHETIYFIDNKGNLLNTLDINNCFNSYIDSTYMVYPVLKFLSNKKCLFIASYSDIDNPYRNSNLKDYLKFYMKKAINTNRLLVVDDIYSDTLVTNQFINNFELNYTDNNHFSLINPYTDIIDSSLFIYTSYDDYIYQYSLLDYSLLMKKKIKSKYSDNIKTLPVIIDENISDNINSVTNIGDNGLILKVHYSKNTEKYYVFVRHEKNNKNTDNNLRYSIICYDQHFTKLGESRLFNSGDGSTFWDDYGIFISLDKTDKNYDKTKKQYHYYEFVKKKHFFTINHYIFCRMFK